MLTEKKTPHSKRLNKLSYFHTRILCTTRQPIFWVKRLIRCLIREDTWHSSIAIQIDVMVNKLATIQGQSGYRYSRLLTNGFSSLTSAKHTVPLIGRERGGKNIQEGGKMPFTSWAAQHSTAPSCPLARPSPRIQTSKRKWDGQTEEQEEDFRPKAQCFTVKSCFVRPLSAKADGGRRLHHQTPRRAAQHTWAPGCPQQRGGGHPSCLRWLFLNHHQLRLFTQRGRSWTRLINDKNTCLF